MSKKKTKHPDLQLVEVDDLCLAALTPVFRCDRDAMHVGNCAHYHSDETLCNWLDSFNDELTEKHRKVKSFGQGYGNYSPNASGAL